VNVGELKQILNSPRQIKDTDNIVVYIKERWVGPTPAVDINSIFSGFDWDKGRLLFYPEKDLCLFKDDKYKTALLQLKKILAHDHRNLPISEIEREECLKIIKGALG